MVEALLWVGPLPVRVIADADHAFLPEIVRFCHRLEMPVTVRTGARGLTAAKAEELVDRGMGACEVVTILDGAGEAAVRSLVHARHSRAASLTVHVHLPVGGEGSLARGFQSARGLGADGVVLCAPWQGVTLGAAVASDLSAALAEGWPLQKTTNVAKEALSRLQPGGPGAPRAAGSCALGGLRLALAPNGAAFVCPFKPGSTMGPLADSGAALADHRAAIRRCDRVCGHPELV
ncbi:hypothetical protein LBMAG42_20500 [Deltaproteobacteria bacterium]|nr:hypothetical protein LBMAG42_20500 [Deltaproteobacteria bacterium]